MEKSKLVVSGDDMPPAPESIELNMRRGDFTIRMWQRGQEQPCRPDALGGGVMGGFVNDTGDFVLAPQATVAVRNEDFCLSKVHCACKKGPGANCGCRRRGFLCLVGCGCGGMCADGAHPDAVGHKPPPFSALPSLLQPHARVRLWERLILAAGLMMITTLSAHHSRLRSTKTQGQIRYYGYLRALRTRTRQFLRLWTENNSNCT
jgi:hypothetical protein